MGKRKATEHLQRSFSLFAPSLFYLLPFFDALFPLILKVRVLAVGTPWTASVREKTLVVAFPERYQVVSWAPLGGGVVEARTILNHQVNIHESLPPEPEVFMETFARRLGIEVPVVGLMTGVLMERVVQKAVTHDDVTT